MENVIRLPIRCIRRFKCVKTKDHRNLYFCLSTNNVDLPSSFAYSSKKRNIKSETEDDQISVILDEYRKSMILLNAVRDIL